MLDIAERNIQPDAQNGTWKNSGMTFALYFLLIALPLYADSPLYSVFGAYGYSATPIFSVFALAVLVLLRQRQGIELEGVSRYMGILLIYLIIVNALALAICAATGNLANRYNENPFTKSVKGIIAFASIVAYLILINNLGKYLDRNRLLFPFFISFIALIVIAVVEYVQIPHAFSWLHMASGDQEYYRPRFLTTESSWTPIQVLVYGGVALYYSAVCKRRFALSLPVIAGLVFICLTTGSKSLLATTLIAVIVGMIIAIKRDARWLIAGVLLLMLALTGESILSRFILNLSGDIAQYTSYATRVSTGIAAVVHALIYPFGVGNSAYLVSFPELLENMIPWFESLLPNLNMSEVQGYLTAATDTSIAAKSGLFQYALYWGVVGSVLFVGALLRLAKALLFGHNTFFCVLLILCFVHVTLFSSFEFLYEFFAIVGLGDLLANDSSPGYAR